MINEIMDSLGLADDTEPEEWAEETLNPLLGFQIIGEMSKADLIAECIAFQRGQWEQADLNLLKRFVVESRLQTQKARLMEEANFDGYGGIFSAVFGGPSE